VDLTSNDSRRRRVIDNDRAVRKGSQYAVASQYNFADIGIISDTDEHNIGISRRG
jgi:hypothetical protein